MQANQFASAIDRVNFAKNYAGKSLFFLSRLKGDFFVCPYGLKLRGSLTKRFDVKIEVRPKGKVSMNA